MDIESRDYRRYGRDERLQLIDKMLEQKYREHASWDDVADTHGVARSTIRRWRMSDEWRLAEARWRRILREESRSDMTMVAPDMIGVLQDLAHHAKSEFTRYSAAAKLLDLVGVGDEAEEQRADHSAELLKFIQKMQNRQSGSPQGEVIEAEVRPGGLLPEVVVEQNRELVARRLEEDS